MNDDPTLFDRVEILDEPHKRHRANDDGASRIGAYDVSARAGSAKVRMLEAYATYGPRGAASCFACVDAGLSLASGYRARASELREQELIEPRRDAQGEPVMMMGLLGSWQGVDVITARGLAALRTLGITVAA